MCLFVLETHHHFTQSGEALVNVLSLFDSDAFSVGSENSFGASKVDHAELSLDDLFGNFIISCDVQSHNEVRPRAVFIKLRDAHSPIEAGVSQRLQNVVFIADFSLDLVSVQVAICTFQKFELVVLLIFGQKVSDLLIVDFNYAHTYVVL